MGLKGIGWGSGCRTAILRVGVCVKNMNTKVSCAWVRSPQRSSLATAGTYKVGTPQKLFLLRFFSLYAGLEALANCKRGVVV